MNKRKSTALNLKKILVICVFSTVLLFSAVSAGVFAFTYKQIINTENRQIAGLSDDIVFVISDGIYQNNTAYSAEYLDSICRETERFGKEMNSEKTVSSDDLSDLEKTIVFLNDFVTDPTNRQLFIYSDDVLYCTNDPENEDDSTDAVFTEGSSSLSDELEKLFADEPENFITEPENNEISSIFDYFSIFGSGQFYSKKGMGRICVYRTIMLPGFNNDRSFVLGMLERGINTDGIIQPIHSISDEVTLNIIEETKKECAKFIPVMIFAIVYVLILFFILIFVFSGKISSPIISELDDQEKELEKSEKEKDALMEVNKMKTTFLSDAAHELKTPLMAMSGFAQTAEIAVLSGEDTEVVVQKLKNLSAEANRMAVMVTQILDATRIEEGRMVLEKKLYHLDEIVHETVGTYFPILNKNHNKLSVRIPMEMPKVLVDKARFQRVIVNLVSNALKHTVNGLITISASVSDDEKMITLSIKDTGCGISEDALPHIWDRYYKGKNSETGTGLGLFIAKFIVESHDGEISAKSKIGEGTEFTIRIPVLEVDSEAHKYFESLLKA